MSTLLADGVSPGRERSVALRSGDTPHGLKPNGFSFRFHLNELREIEEHTLKRVGRAIRPTTVETECSTDTFCTLMWIAYAMRDGLSVLRQSQAHGNVFTHSPSLWNPYVIQFSRY